MSEDNMEPPLLGLEGTSPPAPEWFTRALAVPFESYTVTVDDAAIDCRAWGERGKPGLVFFHGNAAHLGWWSFLAPLFAADYRVVAFSLSGMGASDRRPAYSTELYIREGLAAAEAGGALLAGPPVMIGHSAGGMPVFGLAARFPERLRAAIVVDTGLPGPEMTAKPPRHTGRTYPSLSAALDRFRLSPPQPCENIYIADYIARLGVIRRDDGNFAWRFDPRLMEARDLGDSWADLAGAKVPLALIRGERSWLSGGAMEQRMRRTAPAGTPCIAIPEAYHHVMVDQPLALVAALRTLLEAWA